MKAQFLPALLALAAAAGPWAAVAEGAVETVTSPQKEAQPDDLDSGDSTVHYHYKRHYSYHDPYNVHHYQYLQHHHEDDGSGIYGSDYHYYDPHYYYGYGSGRHLDGSLVKHGFVHDNHLDHGYHSHHHHVVDHHEGHHYRPSGYAPAYLHGGRIFDHGVGYAHGVDAIGPFEHFTGPFGPFGFYANYYHD